MTHEEAIAEVNRRRAEDPDAIWLTTERGGEWIVSRLGLSPSRPTGTATKPPPEGPQSDPFSPIQRASWYAGG